MASRRFGRVTPSGTPMVCAPPPCSGTRQRGAPLAGGVRLLTPDGSVDLEAEAIVTIGRDATCDVVLHDPLSSRRHARLVTAQGAVTLENLKSTNGVYLNGARVERDARLHAGDHILVGTTELSVFSPRSS